MPGTSLIAGLLLALCGCQDQEAEASPELFPRKPIKVIVPFAAGGDSDQFARIMQKTLRDEDLLTQPLVILNVPGAGGTVGSRRVRDASPDGYTILNLHEGIFTSKYSNRVSFGPEAFRPIAATGQSSLVICVREDSPHHDLGDLLEAAATQPDRILFGMAQGTPTNFAGRRLEKAAGGNTRFRMVDSGGGAKRRHELVGKHIDVTPFSLAEYTGFEGGGIRAIAYLAEERHPDLPQVPTARELGYEVIMPHVHYWWAPKSTPDAVINRIADALEAAMSGEAMQGKLKVTQTMPFFLRGEELEAHLAVRESEFQDIALVRYEGLPEPVIPVLALVAVLSIIAFLTRRKSEASEPYPWKHCALTAGVLACYVFAMQYVTVPYAIATMGFIPVLAFVIGARTPQTIIRITGLGIVLALLCFFIFTKVLVIDLP